MITFYTPTPEGTAMSWYNSIDELLEHFSSTLNIEKWRLLINFNDSYYWDTNVFNLTLLKGTAIKWEHELLGVFTIDNYN